MTIINFCRQIMLSMLLLTCISCAGYRTSNCSDTCTDTDITTTIQVRISSDQCLNYQHILVNTYERRVTLDGTVENPTQARAALAIAQGVPGVKSVKSKLVIRRYYP